MNHLQYETSPYLLQHAHNPVNWYAWKPEALERARREDKPILVSIGYSTCHWCHVMERESFENQQVADAMNANFICIKVDREERPDVDQIYMEACQIISGSGGWPLNAFLLPDGRPFFAGTYYPPRPSYGRPSWLQVLDNIANAFKNQRNLVEGQARQLTDIISKADGNFVKPRVISGEPSAADNQSLITIHNFTEGEDFARRELLDTIYYSLRDRFDRVEGGFGGAPKFPGTMCIQFLLDYYFYTRNPEALAHAELSLQKMIQGGIYDQLGGGFARYATDREWLIPHFEKMLYDNALLINVLADVYKLTQKAIYKETIEETLEFVLREMSFEEAKTNVSDTFEVSDTLKPLGFYSAYDADSEGIEGKFYVWQKAEIEEILGADASLFCAFYDVTEGGNWEHTTILWRPMSYEDFAEKAKIGVEELKIKLKECRDKLFKIRTLRIPPSLDDKSLLSWNALMISAFARASEALDTQNSELKTENTEGGHLNDEYRTRNVEYRNVAERGLAFIFKNFEQTVGGNALFHTYKNGQAQYTAFLEDYAFLIEALLDVYSISFDKKYLQKARDLADFTLENFFDPKDGLFFFTSENQTDIIVRKKELYDSATPSGNSTMAKSLFRLGILYNDERYQNLSFQMLDSMLESVEKYTSSFAKWASLAVAALYPPFEIAVVGSDALDKAKAVNRYFLPNKIIMADVEADENYPLLAKNNGNTEGGESLIYVCQNYACQRPVSTIEEFLKMVNA
jgi:uncharacterized protein